MSKTVYSDIDYTSIDYEGLRADMIACIKRRIPEYTDFSENDFGVVMAELFAHGLDVISYYTDRHANEMFLATCKDRKSALKIAQQMSYVPRNATPSKFKQVFEVTPSSTGYLIKKGTKVKTEESDVDPQITYEVEEDYFMPANVEGTEKNADGSYKYLVPIVQGATVTREILGTSDGTANQEFQLGYEPVIVDDLLVEVYTNGQYLAWERVDNFLSSKNSDKHFTVTIDEYDTATIRFGDGVNGQIPNTYENGIVATYRVGGGTFGNVGANKITVLNNNMNGVLSTFNPEEAYEKGTDRESLEELKRNIPASVRTRDRAVTLTDYAYLVEETNKVLSAKAMRTDDLEITVYVVQKEPTMSSGTLLLDDDIKDYIDNLMAEKIMVGTTYVTAPAIVKIVNMVVKYRATATVYDAQVKASIENYLHAKLDLGGMAVGEELIISDLISEMNDRETGIDYLRSVIIDSPSDILKGADFTDKNVIVLGTLSVEVF